MMVEIVYMAEDGKTFNTLQEAERHEQYEELLFKFLNSTTYIYSGNSVIELDKLRSILTLDILKQIESRMD